MIYYLVVILKSQYFITMYLVANLLYIDLTPTFFYIPTQCTKFYIEKDKKGMFWGFFLIIYTR